MLAKRLPIPAYDHLLKLSHTFNILDARWVGGRGGVGGGDRLATGLVPCADAVLPPVTALVSVVIVGLAWLACRGAIGVTERANCFATMRALAREVTGERGAAEPSDQGGVPQTHQQLCHLSEGWMRTTRMIYSPTCLPAGLWISRREELQHPLGVIPAPIVPAAQPPQVLPRLHPMHRCCCCAQPHNMCPARFVVHMHTSALHLPPCCRSPPQRPPPAHWPWRWALRSCPLRSWRPRWTSSGQEEGGEGGEGRVVRNSRRRPCIQSQPDAVLTSVCRGAGKIFTAMLVGMHRADNLFLASALTAGSVCQLFCRSSACSTAASQWRAHPAAWLSSWRLWLPARQLSSHRYTMWSSVIH
jgi:hypothetical protein